MIGKLNAPKPEKKRKEKKDIRKYFIKINI